MYTDPTGHFVQVVTGAITGVALDLGSQVVINIISGNDPLDNINGKSLVASAIIGAVTGGLKIPSNLD